MRVQHVEGTALIGVLVVLIGLSIWMQFSLLARDADPALISVDTDQIISSEISSPLGAMKSVPSMF